MISIKDQGMLFNKYRGELMGIASIWIAIMHSFTELFPNINITPIVAHGGLGVEIFLVLSGIGLYYSLNKNANVKTFYIKRINRVIIPWLIVSLPYWLPLDFLRYHFTFKRFLLDYFGISLWTHGTKTVWYVSFILVMYAIYPLIFKLQKKFSEAPLVLAILVIIANLLLFKFHPDYYKKIDIALTRIPTFLFGSYLGECLSRYEHKQKALPASKFCIITYIIIAMVCFIIGDSKIFEKSISTMFYRYGSTGIVIIFMLFCCIILNFIELGKIRSILKFFGSMSLEFYLINVFLRNCTVISHFADNFTSWQQLLVSTALVIISALVTYLMVKLIDLSKAKTVLNKFIKA